MVAVSNWPNYVAKTRFTGCILEWKIEGKLSGHGEIDTEYRFEGQSSDSVEHYHELAWIWLPNGTCTWEKRGSQVVVWKAKLRENRVGLKRQMQSIA